jgi:hypothetical protein
MMRAAFFINDHIAIGAKNEKISQLATGVFFAAATAATYYFSGLGFVANAAIVVGTSVAVANAIPAMLNDDFKSYLEGRQAAKVKGGDVLMIRYCQQYYACCQSESLWKPTTALPKLILKWGVN